MNYIKMTTSNHLVQYALSSAAYGGSYYALEMSGILDKLPGLANMEQSQSMITRAVANGGVMALAEEGVGLVTGNSLLLNGHYLRYIDNVIVNGGLDLALTSIGIDKILDDAFGTNSDIAKAASMGTAIELTVLAREWATQYIAAMPNADTMQILVYPATYIGTKLGMHA